MASSQLEVMVKLHCCFEKKKINPEKQRTRREVVHSNDSLRVFQTVGDELDGKSGSVGGDDTVAWNDGLEARQNLVLQFKVFRHCFNDEVDILEERIEIGSVVGRGDDSAENLISLEGRQAPLLHSTLEVGEDLLLSASDSLLVLVVKNDLVSSLLSRDLSDTGTHKSSTQHGDLASLVLRLSEAILLKSGCCKEDTNKFL